MENFIKNRIKIKYLYKTHLFIKKNTKHPFVFRLVLSKLFKYSILLKKVNMWFKFLHSF